MKFDFLKKLWEKRIFENPANGYRVYTKLSWVWSLLIGPFYYLYHRAYNHAILLLVLGGPMFVVPWLLYTIFARDLIAAQYLRDGWVEVDED